MPRLLALPTPPLDDDRRTLALSCLPMVRKLASRFAGRRDDLFDDYLGAGHEGLIDAAGRFDPSRGNKFSTYAYWYIRGYITDLRDRSAACPTPTDPDILAFTTDPGAGPEAPVDLADDRAAIRRRVAKLLWRLPDRQREVIERLYFAPATIPLTAVARDMGVTQQRGSYLLKSALSQLRESALASDFHGDPA